MFSVSLALYCLLSSNIKWSLVVYTHLSVWYQTDLMGACVGEMDLLNGSIHQSIQFSFSDVAFISQFSSVSQSCMTLCDPMDFSMPYFPVHHQLLDLSQTHAHWVSDTIQPAHPLLPPSSPAFNFSQHQGLFQWVSSSHQVAKVLEFQHQFFQWIFRTYFLRIHWLDLLATRVFSNTTVQEHQILCAQLSL